MIWTTKKLILICCFAKLNISRATAPPFFFNRVQARLRKSQCNFLNRSLCLLSRPRVAFLFLMVVLATDIVAIRQGGTQASDMKSPASKTLDDSDLDIIAFYQEGPSD